MKICDELDCPLHPDYVQDIKHVADHMHYISTSNNSMQNDSMAWSTWKSAATIQSPLIGSLKIETKYITSHMECFFCQYRKNIDMKKEIIVANAKQLLQE